MDNLDFHSQSDVTDTVRQAMRLLRDLCDEPSIYVNSRAFTNQFQEPSSIVITVSNRMPKINYDTFEVSYPKDATAVDVFSDSNPSEFRIAVTKHWIHLVCSLLVFRGHEVFLDNKVYQPNV